ncbi:MAG: PilZ domain-containing protein [Haliangium ochraceum]
MLRPDCYCSPVALFAPLAVPVEIGAGERRVFRLSRLVADTGLRLENPAPFEVGQPVSVTFALAERDAMVPLALRAVIQLTDDDGEGADGGRELTFVDPPREARAAIVRYVAGRLGLPGGTPWP